MKCDDKFLKKLIGNNKFDLECIAEALNDIREVRWISDEESNKKKDEESDEKMMI